VSKVLDADPILFRRFEAPEAQIEPPGEAPRKSPQNAYRQLNGDLRDRGLATCFFATDFHGQERVKKFIFL
jgi:hypothetical protein